MSRIEKTFADLKAGNRKALIGYLTAGNPDLPTSLRHVEEALANGVDILELGVPFSDPTADGPVIQQAGQRALAAGTTLDGILAMVSKIRRKSQAPIILFGYVNPFLAYGFEKLAADAAAAGADGLLVVDMPYEESSELRTILDRNGLCWIPLIAPTTSIDRAAMILREANRGFVYYIMVKGVTGARAAVAGDAAEHLAGLRRCTKLPIAAGFGVGNGAQARAVSRLADAVVVGSALVQAAQEGRLVELVRELRSALC